MLLNLQRNQIRIQMPRQVRVLNYENISISPVIAGIAFVQRGLSTGEMKNTGSLPTKGFPLSNGRDERN